MRDYVILTDSCSDLPADLVSELELDVLPLSFVMEGKEYFNYPDNRDIDPKDFYNKMRSGALGTTSAINVAVFAETMTALVGQEKDILCISFSSALSTTYQSACIAAEDVMAAHPGSKILVCDSRAASLGQGLLVYLAALEKRKGRTLEELRDFVEERKNHISHWFTVDDLYHLKRGGRVSAATAIVGSALNIKPMLKIDEDGKLVTVDKKRGNKAAMASLFTFFKENYNPKVCNTIYICDADTPELADSLVEKVREAAPEVIVRRTMLSPIIGAHTGPGMLSMILAC